MLDMYYLTAIVAAFLCRWTLNAGLVTTLKTIEREVRENVPK